MGVSKRTPPSSVTAFYFVEALRMVGEVAAILGESTDSEKLNYEHQVALKAYHQRYFNATVGCYSPVDGIAPYGSQTSNAMALVLDAMPDKTTRDKVGECLVKAVEEREVHLTGGIVGMVVLFPALQAIGRGDLAIEILRQDTYPGFGHMLQQGLTALCENWQCQSHMTGGGSMNHIMFGAFDGWLVTGVAGLDTRDDVGHGGWRVVQFGPTHGAYDLVGSAMGRVDTRFGEASISWSYDAAQKQIHTNVTVPVGAVGVWSVPLSLPHPHRALQRLATPDASLLWSATPTSEGDLNARYNVSRAWSEAAPVLEVSVVSGQHHLIAHYA
mmetsp:Transcript_13529/g.32030  ORF Transcript_13529/g.32030 Transcript_13529/m.32030 type:complete len:328 (+) Transcript_13529:120-1103(+)